MRVFHCLVVIAVICGFTGLAKADPVDFHMNILDPPPSSYPTFPIFSTPFAISFTACVAGELPDGNTGEGCFAGHNETGQDWNNLQLTFADNTALASQLADCSPAPSDNIFSTANCSLVGSTYVLSFSDGVVSNGDYFFITEDGVDPESFGTGTGTVLTPEPASILLLSTGFVLFGLLVNMKRWHAVRSLLLS